ncbi:MAG: Fic family protein [Candidatus Hodarchaeota archaeon]
MVSKRLRQRVYNKRKQLDKLRPIPPNILKNIRERYNSIFVYNSNAIEGNTLTESETILVLERGITIGGKSLKEHLEAINHKKAIEYIHEIASKKIPISEEMILNLHSILMKDVLPDEQVGKYRTRSVIIQGAVIQPPVAQEVPHEMENLIFIINNNPEKIDPFEFCAQIHAKFEQIHPFSDGNGRIGRLLLNLMLIHQNFIPLTIKKIDRMTYLDVLSKADQGNYGLIINFLLRCEEQALDFYLEAFTPNFTPFNYKSLSELAKNTQYSPAYLNLLIRQGKIPGKKIGKKWFTTMEAIQNYIKSVRKNEDKERS